MPSISVNGTTNRQDALLHQARASVQTKPVSRADAVPPVWCSTADDLVNSDDFRLAVMKNDLKLIESFVKHGKYHKPVNTFACKCLIRMQFVKKVR